MPQWKSKIRKGENATTNFSGVWCTMKSKGVNVYTESVYNPNPTGYPHCTRLNSGNICVNNNIYSPGFHPSLSVTLRPSVDNRARQQFYKKLRQTQQQFSALTFAGELKETLHMLRNPAVALLGSAQGYLAELKRIKRRSPKAWTKSIGGTWLEYSFGWVPLINDCKDAAKALERLGLPRTMRISAGSQGEEDVTKATVGTAGQSTSQVNGGNFFKLTATRIESCTVRYRAALRAKADVATWGDEQWSLFGFTPRDILPTAWELLPWSFLADYFTNIGDIINSAVTDTSELAWTSRTEITSVLNTLQMDPVFERSIPGPDFRIVGHGGSSGRAELTRKEVTRNSVSGVPIPTLSFEIALSYGQKANCAALLTNALSLHSQSPRRGLKPFLGIFTI
jgi:hypothetical protein